MAVIDAPACSPIPSGVHHMLVIFEDVVIVVRVVTSSMRTNVSILFSEVHLSTALLEGITHPTLA